MIVKLSTTLPRSQKEIDGIPLKKGLRHYFFIAYAMFITAGLGFLSGVLNMIYIGNWLLAFFQALVGTGVFTLLGLIPFYLPAQKKLQLRTIAFQKGSLTDAIIVRIDRTFVAWKSARDWLVEAEVILPNGKKLTGTLQTGSRQLVKNLQIGTRIQALCCESESIIFLPLEIGMQVSLSSEQNQTSK
jgi:hypothetical protein